MSLIKKRAKNTYYDDTVSGIDADDVQEAIDEIVLSGGSQPFTELTDPALNSINTAMIDTKGGVVITLTGAGNNQTLPTPTDTDIAHQFTVINNDTSTDNIDIIGAVTVTLQPGMKAIWTYDGTAWISTEATGIWLDDGTDVKLQNSTRNINLQSGILKDNDITAGISLGDASNTTLNAGLGSSSLLGGINDNIQSQIDETNTGFISWGGAGNYYSCAGNVFTVLRPGTGRVKGKLVSWTAGQSVNLANNKTAFIYIDNTGTIGQVTHDVQDDDDYYDYIMLMEVFYNGSCENVVDECHPYTENSRLSRYLHHNVGTVIRGSGAIITRVATGTGASADDRRIKTVGDDVLDDHGLSTTLTATNPVTWSNVYTDGSGNWMVYSDASENPMYYNNAGTPTVIPNGKYVNFRLYASKQDPNTGNPVYFRVMGSVLHNNLAAANLAITNNTVPSQNNELFAIELAQLGFETVLQNVDGGYINQLIVSKATFNSQLVGGGVIGEHDLLSNIKLATTGVTYGHIDDQAQVIYGAKDFNDGIDIGTSGTPLTSISTGASNNDKLPTQGYVNDYTKLSPWRPAVDLKDDTATNAGSQIVGQASYNADSVALVNGDRLLITAETTAPATYKNRVFIVGGVGSSITLTLETDGQAGDGSPTLGDTITVQRGTANANKSYLYNGTTFILGSVSGGALLSANNLSDVASVSTSLDNLGLGSSDTPIFGTGITFGNLPFYSNSDTVADDDEIVINANKSGFGWCSAGDVDGFIHFYYTSSDVVGMDFGGNIADIDQDGDLCVYYNGSPGNLAIKNRLGSAKKVRYFIMGS